MKITLTLILLLTVSWIKADTLTIQQCFDLAIQLHPTTERTRLNDEIARYMRENTLSSKLPQIALNGQVSYQSDVVDFPDNPLLGIDIPKLQSRLFLDIQQVLYSGGRVDMKDELDQTMVQRDQMEVEVEMKKTKETILQIYFGILTGQKKLELIDEALSDFERQIVVMESRVSNGVVLPSSIDRFLIEKIKLESQRIEAVHQLGSLHKLLDTWIGIISSDKTFVLPGELQMSTDIQSPELLMMDRNIQILDVSSKIAKSNRMPSLALFLQGGVGQPNPLNFFETDFQPYYIGGIKLSWKLLDYSNTENTIGINRLRAESISLQKQHLTNLIQRQQIRLADDKQAMESMLNKDSEAVVLQNRIVEVSKSQYDNGVITTSQYLQELTTLNRLKIQEELRKIFKVKSSWDDSILTGKI